jgi:hypothetical protein
VPDDATEDDIYLAIIDDLYDVNYTIEEEWLCLNDLQKM